MIGGEELTTFLLVLVRCLSFYGIGPLFTHQKVPPQIQLLAGVATAVALYPTVDPEHWVFEGHLLGLALLIAREVFLGGLFGLVAAAIFAAIRFAGSLIGVQMGFSIANVLDPSGAQTPLIGRMQEVFAVLLFLILDGHHVLIRGLGASLAQVPPGGFPEPSALLQAVVPIGTAVFLLAIQVGAPVIAALFLTDTALGFVARAVPQMNIFLVGMPVKIAAGFLFLVVTTPLFGLLIRRYTEQMGSQMLAILGGM